MSELKSAIDEIERVLIGNKSRDVEEVYLNNAIRFIKEYSQPQLNSNQQVVLEWFKLNTVKEEYSFMPTGLIFELMNKSKWIDENIIEIWRDELREDQKHQVIVAYLG